MSEPRVLVVEDDSSLADLLTRGLREEGFDVTGVRRGADALRTATDASFDAVVLDIGLPDSDGRDLCQALRAQGLTAPVLFLTARDALTDRLSGFSAGGDDYVTKPFEFEEVVARLRALLKRSTFDAAETMGELRLDPATHAAERDGESVPLTPTEFRLLAALVAQPDQVVRRRDLVRVAWPEGAIVHDNTLDVYLARLRRKLKVLPGAPTIETAHGVGYRIR